MEAGETCSIDDCGRPLKVISRRLCNRHYRRWQRTGDPIATIRQPPGLCAASDCDRTAAGKSLCKMHHKRLRRNGSPELRPERSPLPLGMKWCSGDCKEPRPLGEFSSPLQGACRPCTTAAMRRWRKANPERVVAQGARRARAVGSAVETFTSHEIFERDSWICRLCEKPVDREKRFPHPSSPSIDHIIPIARGGAHARANVQTAHLVCNSRKGASIT